MKLTQLERSKTDLKRVSYAINKFLGFLIIYFNSVKVSRGIFKKSRDPIVSFAYQQGRRVLFHKSRGLFSKVCLGEGGVRVNQSRQIEILRTRLNESFKRRVTQSLSLDLRPGAWILSPQVDYHAPDPHQTTEKSSGQTRIRDQIPALHLGLTAHIPPPSPKPGNGGAACGHGGASPVSLLDGGPVLQIPIWGALQGDGIPTTDIGFTYQW